MNRVGPLTHRDTSPAQRLGKVVPGFGRPRLDQQHVRLVGVRVALRFSWRPQAGKASEGLGIPARERLPLGNKLVGLSELGDPDRSLEVSHPVIEANLV